MTAAAGIHAGARTCHQGQAMTPESLREASSSVTRAMRAAVRLRGRGLFPLTAFLSGLARCPVPPGETGRDSGGLLAGDPEVGL
jgi:hypothetical protein